MFPFSGASRSRRSRAKKPPVTKKVSYHLTTAQPEPFLPNTVFSPLRPQAAVSAFHVKTALPCVLRGASGTTDTSRTKLQYAKDCQKPVVPSQCFQRKVCGASVYFLECDDLMMRNVDFQLSFPCAARFWSTAISSKCGFLSCGVDLIVSCSSTLCAVQAHLLWAKLIL